jgi:hypothetical protein
MARRAEVPVWVSCTCLRTGVSRLAVEAITARALSLTRVVRSRSAWDRTHRPLVAPVALRTDSGHAVTRDAEEAGWATSTLGSTRETLRVRVPALALVTRDRIKFCCKAIVTGWAQLVGWSAAPGSVVTVVAGGAVAHVLRTSAVSACGTLGAFCCGCEPSLAVVMGASWAGSGSAGSRGTIAICAFYLGAGSVGRAAHVPCWTALAGGRPLSWLVRTISACQGGRGTGGTMSTCWANHSCCARGAAFAVVSRSTSGQLRLGLRDAIPRTVAAGRARYAFTGPAVGVLARWARLWHRRSLRAEVASWAWPSRSRAHRVGGSRWSGRGRPRRAVRACTTRTRGCRRAFCCAMLAGQTGDALLASGPAREVTVRSCRAFHSDSCCGFIRLLWAVVSFRACGRHGDVVGLAFEAGRAWQADCLPFSWLEGTWTAAYRATIAAIGTRIGSDALLSCRAKHVVVGLCRREVLRRRLGRLRASGALEPRATFEGTRTTERVARLAASPL